MKRPITILEMISFYFYINFTQNGGFSVKNFLLILFGLICIALLIVGNQYWEQRIAGAPSTPAGKNTAEEPASDSAEAVQVDSLISNWPEKAQKQFKEAMNDEAVYKIALVGSPAMGSGENGWSEQLTNELSSVYEDGVEVTIFQSETTSVHFTESELYEEVMASQPDLVLFEPFTLIDNSIGVPFERNHEIILSFYEELKKTNSGVEMILQPSYPIAGATYYPKQVGMLKTFAEENDFTYLDHWTKWPEEEELEEFLLPSQEGPNEEGHELWAEYMIDYFIHDPS
jgi:hypothetical protein